jgi:hypothetical protein
MWYTETEKETLDLTKPICANSISCEDTVYLLLPSNVDKGYQFRGYDWFNPETGEYNSCVNYQTVEEALGDSYTNVRNCNISLR